MKYLVVSDIHGSLSGAEILKESFKYHQADAILCLGDILYHGPRNDLPKEYDPKQVIAMLNARKQDILCVRGNCDGEVDQMVLEFPIMADYCVLTQDKGIIYATHGHHFNEQNLPPLHRGDILLHGHTHVPKCVEHDEYVYLNPGSVSIPKEDSWHGYMTLKEGIFRWKDLKGNEKMHFNMK